MDTRLKLLNCGFVIENNFEVNPKKFTKYISSIGPIANWGQFVFDYYGNRLPIPTIFPNPDDWEDDFTYPVQRVTGLAYRQGQRQGGQKTGPSAKDRRPQGLKDLMARRICSAP